MGFQAFRQDFSGKAFLGGHQSSKESIKHSYIKSFNQYFISLITLYKLYVSSILQVCKFQVSQVFDFLWIFISLYKLSFLRYLSRHERSNSKTMIDQQKINVRFSLSNKTRKYFEHGVITILKYEIMSAILFWSVFLIISSIIKPNQNT